MQYSPNLIPARLIKRYKRFLVDVILESGEQITVHCANTGAMTGCAPEGARVWLSDSQNPKRKLRYSLEWVCVNGEQKVCVNTSRANQLVAEFLTSERNVDFAPITQLIKEPKVADGRLDFLLHHPLGASTYMEVKSLTLLADPHTGLGRFPDALTERGRKHLLRLLALKKQGFRAVLLFCVAHEGVKQVQAAAHIDPAYAATLKQVKEQGVEIFAYQVRFAEQSMLLEQPLPFID